MFVLGSKIQPIVQKVALERMLEEGVKECK
jgi:hypothetical protein